MRLSAKCKNVVEAGHGPDFILQELPTGRQFAAGRFVVRRQAADSIGDPHIMQPDVIIGIGAVGAACQPETRQHVKKIAASDITGKRAARAIGPAQTGRQTNNQDSGIKAAQ